MTHKDLLAQIGCRVQSDRLKWAKLSSGDGNHKDQLDWLQGSLEGCLSVSNTYTPSESPGSPHCMLMLEKKNSGSNTKLTKQEDNLILVG